MLDASATELPRIRIVSDFEHVAVDISRMARQKRLDVVAVNTLAPLRAEDTANRLQAARGSRNAPTLLEDGVADAALVPAASGV